jgi:hypothetical protein
MATDYNAGNGKFETFTAMCEYDGAVRGTIADTLQHGVECDPHKNSGTGIHYVRTGAIPDGQDIKTYDLGKLQVGLYGVPTDYSVGTNLGLVWVYYSVRVMKPRFWTSPGNTILYDAFYRAAGPVTSNLIFTSVTKKDTQNTLGGTINTSTSSYVFPDNFTGTVIVMLGFSAAPDSSDDSLDALTLHGNVTGKGIFSMSNEGNNQAYIHANATGSSTLSIDAYYYMMDVTATTTPGDNYFTVKGNTDGNADCSMVISQVNPKMTSATSYVFI